MIRFFLLILGAVFVVLCFTACPLPGDIAPGGRNYSSVTFETRTFNVQRMDNDDWYVLGASKLAEGAHCVVFVSNTELESVPVGLADYIAAEYDAKIYGTISSVFGDYISKGFDVDGNGKTILLLLDIQDGYSGSGGYVAGYFDPNHMYDVSVYPKSNQADMLFIDVNPQSPRSMGFYVTLAHELQHLINFAMHNGHPQETWLNEGLSSAAEYLYGGQQMSRINYFNSDPKGTIARGNNFFVWDGHWEKNEDDALANYATVYLFFQWIRIHHTGRNGVYSAIAGSEHTDYRALTQAVKGRIPGITETEDAEIWDRVLRSWMIANYRNDSTSLYGYKKELTVILKKIVSSSDSVSLFPGEGVFSAKPQTQSPPGSVGSTNINYIDAGIPDSTVNSVPVSANVLLSYNANTNPRGDAEQAYVYPVVTRSLTQEAGTAAARSVVVPESAVLPPSYPIGAHDLRFRRPPVESGPSPESAVPR
ncbi:MAG: hypothetical protein LBF95_09945 [Treponema sp.]|nr:hypothetical protein [Treponema sp.]